MYRPLRSGQSRVGPRKQRNVQEKGFKDFSESSLGQLSFKGDHCDGGHCSDNAVTQITEHDGEQEGEGDAGKQSRVDFLVCSNTVRINDCLETLGEFVGPVKGRRRLVGSQFRQDGRNSCACGFRRTSQRLLNSADIPRRTPTFGSQSLLFCVVAEQVHRLIDSLFPTDGVFPGHDALRNLAQFNSSSLPSLEQDRVDVFKSRRDFSKSFIPLVSARVDRVKSSTHGIRHFSDLCQQFGAVGKNDEDVLVSFLVSRWIHKRFLDFCDAIRLALFGWRSIAPTRIIHVQVSSQDSPQDPLEHGHSAALDCTGDKIQIYTLKSTLSRESAVFSSVFEKRCRSIRVIE